MGYTPSTSDPVDSGKTITNTQVSTEVIATKEWKNADGTTKAPADAKVTFTLYKDGTATTKTVTLDGTADGNGESEAWKATFTGLAQYNADGEAIKYTVVESGTWPGYTASGSPASNGGTITNTQDETNANARKAWKNADGTTAAPNGATVVYTLFANEKATDYTVTLTGTAGTEPDKTGGYESAAWTAMFVHLPKYEDGTTTPITYTVKETTGYPGYTADKTGEVASGELITNTQETTEVEVEKTWANADGSKTWPSGVTVTVQLTADGKDVTGKTATLSADQTSYKFTSLPKYQADGKTEIAYSVKEVKVAGYTTEIGDLTSGKITVTNTQETTEVEVDKKWVNADGSETWPAGVTVSIQLTADKEAVAGKTATLSADQTSYKFTSLPKYKVVDGKEVEIEYSVEEAKVAGYTTEVGELTEGKITVTNTQETVDVNVTKVWEDQQDAHGLRPDSIIINLLADGKELQRAVLDGKADEDEAGFEKEAWVATFSSLPKYQADGTTKIEYTVTENAVQGYITAIERKAEEGSAVEETEDVTETAEAETAESETSETDDTTTKTEKDGPIEYTVTNTLISLEITKEVQNLFDAGGTSNATFVFEVKIGTKYLNYAAIIFDGKAGTDSTVMYGLPYEEGDIITVEEVYTAGHKLVSQTAVTWDGEDKIFKVSFVNTYNNTPGYGSGIINEYSHDEKGNPVVTNQSKQNTVS